MNAVDLAHAHLAGEMDSEEAARYQTLLETSDEHVLALAQARSVRALLTEARAEAEQMPIPPFQATDSRSSTPTPRWWVPVGALALASLALFILEMPPSPLTGGAPPAMRTAASEPAHLILADGSQLEWIDESRFDHLEGRRDNIAIRLHSGQITANVVPAPGADRQFVILAGDVEVRVLGTRFHVAWDGVGAVQVAVDKGRVLVTTGTASQELEAGHSADFPAAHPRALETPAAAPLVKVEKTRSAPSATRTRPRPTAPVAPNPENPSGPSPRAPSSSPKATTPPGTPSQTALAPPAPAAASPSGPESQTTRFRDPVVAELAALIPAITANGCAATLPQLEHFMRTRKGHRTTVDALYLKGYCLYQMGNQEAAIGLWKQVERRQPRGPWLRTVRDWTQPRPPDVARLR